MLPTALPDLFLGTLGPADAKAFYDLLQKNRAHLTALGDFLNEVSAPLEKWTAEFASDPAPGRRFGIFHEQRLIGRIDLIAVEPPKYGLGYWLDEQSTGQGYATAALSRLLMIARDEIRASDIYAGVTHGNVRSEALLERLGFRRATRFERYTRFHHGL